MFTEVFRLQHINLNDTDTTCIPLRQKYNLYEINSRGD